MSSMDKFKDDMIWSLKLYSLTLIFPILFTMAIVLFTAFDVETKFSFWEMMKISWIDFYFTGSFLEIEAWKWHLLLLITSFIITTSSN
jgi:hypothetical protein